MDEKGYGCQQELAKAVEWYTKASDMGLPLASHNLAILYENGRGVEKDRQRAIALYEMAAEAGHKPSAEALERLRSSRNGLHLLCRILAGFSAFFCYLGGFVYLDEYGTDPVGLRMMLICGGLSAVLYALCWKVFPRQTPRLTAGRRKGQRAVHLVMGIFLTLLVLALVMALAAGMDMAALWTLLWCAALAALAFLRFARLKK